MADQGYGERGHQQAGAVCQPRGRHERAGHGDGGRIPGGGGPNLCRAAEGHGPERSPGGKERGTHQDDEGTGGGSGERGCDPEIRGGAAQRNESGVSPSGQGGRGRAQPQADHGHHGRCFWIFGLGGIGCRSGNGRWQHGWDGHVGIGHAGSAGLCGGRERQERSGAAV